MSLDDLVVDNTSFLRQMKFWREKDAKLQSDRES
jgi:hypothetical protein